MNATYIAGNQTNPWWKSRVLETDHKIHVDESAALARTSECTNYLKKGAIGTQSYTKNFQHM